MKHRSLALDIRRGLLQIVGAIRKHQATYGDAGRNANDPGGIALALADVLEAAADGIKAKFEIGQNEGRR